MISVIVPIYKVEKYLRQCIESIRQQTYRELEIILVDDGSPDGCPGICEEYAALDKRIKVIHQANVGLSGARNAGLDAATGEYIAFVDSDDFIKPNMYEFLYDKLIAADADMAICSYDKVNEKGEKMINESPIQDEILESYELLKKLPIRKGWYYVTVWNRLYRKEVFADIRFPKGKMHEDEAVAHKVIVACKKAVTVSESLYYYRRTDNSIMSKHATVKRLDGVEAVYERFLFYENQGYEELLPGAYHSAREAFEVMRYIRCKTKEDKARKQEIKEMYRYIFRSTNTRKRIKDYIIAWVPELYFGIKNIR